MSPEERAALAMQRAEVLFGCYRRGDANDPERYVGSIAAVLSLYDEDIIREATDPRFGISTSEKHRSFMPNSGELKAYCDSLAERKHRLQQLAAIPRPIPASHRIEPQRQQGDFANIFVPEGHPRYAKLCEWTKTAHIKFWKFGPSSDNRPGLGVSLDVWEGNKQERPGQARPSPDWANLKLGPEVNAVLAQRWAPPPSNEDPA